MKVWLAGLTALNVLALSACTGSQSVLSLNGKGSNAEIVGGKLANLDDLQGTAVTRSTVALMTEFEGQLYSFCSGTLIAPNLVLTAGHCVLVDEIPKEKIFVFFGAKLPKLRSEANLLEVDSLSANPDFKTAMSERGEDDRFNDVAVIKLKADAPAGFEPVNMLDPAYKLEAGTEVLLAGFGLIQDIPSRVEATELSYVHVKISEADEKIVTTDQNAGSGACAGDSGGPAYLETKKGLLVFGDTRGPKPGSQDCEHFGEYTYSSKFKSFIEDAAKKLNAISPKFVMPEEATKQTAIEKSSEKPVETK